MVINWLTTRKLGLNSVYLNTRIPSSTLRPFVHLMVVDNDHIFRINIVNVIL